MKNIMNFSYGKDSMASLILAETKGIHIDEYVFCEVLFDRDTSGENPLHAEWIPKANERIKELFDREITVVKANETYIEKFFTVKQKGNYVGDIYGHPPVKGAWCNNRLKTSVLNRYIKKQGECMQYVGIAFDESKRLAGMKKRGQYSLLEQFEYTEKMAYDLCKQYGLLSPIYTNGLARGGCWFCVKQRVAELRLLYERHPDLWKKLKSLDGYGHNKFKNNMSVAQWEQRFKDEKSQITIEEIK